MKPVIRRRPKKLTEKSIQNLLYAHLRTKGHVSIVPNCKVFDWEADLTGGTQAGLVTEYEIKISRSDFLADRHKVMKHIILAKDKDFKLMDRPHRFYYVVPEGLVFAEEVPKYAGLIAIINGCPCVQKKAPVLHRFPMPLRVMNYINRGLMIRYWKSREV